MAIIGGIVIWALFLAGCGHAAPAFTPTTEVIIATPPPAATRTPTPSPDPVPIAGTPTPTSLPAAPVPGALAPDFVVVDLEGNPIQLSHYRGRRVLLNFWATWCPPCRGEMPAFQQAYELYGGEDFVVLAVNFQESAQAVREFVDQFHITFPVGIDPDGAVFLAYQIRSVPTSFFIGSDGVVLGRYQGALTLEALEQALAMSE